MPGSGPLTREAGSPWHPQRSARRRHVLTCDASGWAAIRSWMFEAESQQPGNFSQGHFQIVWVVCQLLLPAEPLDDARSCTFEQRGLRSAGFRPRLLGVTAVVGRTVATVLSGPPPVRFRTPWELYRPTWRCRPAQPRPGHAMDRRRPCCHESRQPILDAVRLGALRDLATTFWSGVGNANVEALAQSFRAMDRQRSSTGTRAGASISCNVIDSLSCGQQRHSPTHGDLGRNGLQGDTLDALATTL